MLNLDKKITRNKLIYISLLVVLYFYFFIPKSRAFEPGVDGITLNVILNLQGKNSEDILSPMNQNNNSSITMSPNATRNYEMVFYFYSPSVGSFMGYAEGIGNEWGVNLPIVNDFGITPESIRGKIRWNYRFTSLDTDEISIVTWDGAGSCQTSNPMIVEVSCSDRFFTLKNVSTSSITANIEVVSDYLAYKIYDTQKLYIALKMNRLAIEDARYRMGFVSRTVGIDDGRSGAYYMFGVIGGGCSINVNPIVVDFKSISNYSEQELASISDVSLGNVNCTWDKVERPYYRFNIDMNGLPELKNENNDVLGIVKGSLHGQATCTDDGLVSSQGQIYQNNANGDVLSSWVLCKKAGIPYPNAGEYTASGTMNIYLP